MTLAGYSVERRLSIMRKHIATLFMLMFSIVATAQNVCTEKLSGAEALFEIGHLYEIHGVIEECLANGFTREEKIKAYRLLTLTYLYLDEYSKADEMYLSLLKLNPEFEPNPAVDPAELFNLHKQFISQPKWSFIVAKTGLNLSFLRIYNMYNADGWLAPIYENEPSYTHRKDYIPSAGGILGSGMKYGYSEKLGLTGELLFKFNRFKVKEYLLGHTAMTFNEEQIGIELPIYVNYDFPRPKIKPYVIGGGSVSLLIYSSAKNPEIERRQGATILPDSGPNVSLNKNRNSFGLSALIGCGVKYKIGVSYLMVEARQVFGLKNMVEKDNRYENKEMLHKYMYVDDDMCLNNLIINISYLKPFYNPHKRKIR